MTDGKVVAAVLVEEDVAALESCLGEVVYKFLLIERQLVESRYFVAEHLDVGKAVDMIVEVCCSSHVKR